MLMVDKSKQRTFKYCVLFSFPCDFPACLKLFSHFKVVFFSFPVLSLAILIYKMGIMLLSFTS